MSQKRSNNYEVIICIEYVVDRQHQNILKEPAITNVMNLRLK